MPSTEKAARLVKHVVERLSGRISKTYLAKLVYLCDLHSREFRGEPITELKYTWHYYGPWDGSLDRILLDLATREVIRCELVQMLDYTGCIFHNGPTKLESSLSSAERRVAEFVIGKYASRSLRSLLDDVVYQTPPMREAQRKGSRGARLRMSQMDNKRAGQYVPFTFDEIAEALEDDSETIDFPSPPIYHPQ